MCEYFQFFIDNYPDFWDIVNLKYHSGLEIGSSGYIGLGR
jgi:hypothetical protein